MADCCKSTANNSIGRAPLRRTSDRKQDFRSEEVAKRFHLKTKISQHSHHSLLPSHDSCRTSVATSQVLSGAQLIESGGRKIFLLLLIFGLGQHGGQYFLTTNATMNVKQLADKGRVPKKTGGESWPGERTSMVFGDCEYQQGANVIVALKRL